MNCATCHKPVWVDPRSFAGVEATEGIAPRVICVRCMNEELERDA